MSNRNLVCALLFTFGGVHGLHAGDVSFYGGIDYTSDYVSNGISQTNGKPTVQAYIEAELDGFYVGGWASGVDFGDADNAEIDLYLGYRTQFPNEILLDAGYAHYFYDKSGSCCGEFKATAVFPVGEDFGVVGYLAVNPQSYDFNKSLGFAYAVNEQFGLTGKYGKTDFNDNEYWQVGASMAFSQFLSGKIVYHGSETGDAGLVFTLSIASDQSNFARLILNPFAQ